MVRAFRIFSLFMVLPAVLLHELLHYLPARILAKNVKLELGLTPHVEYDYDREWIPKVVGLFPTIVAACITPFVASLMNSAHFLLKVYVAALLAVIMFPSQSDLRGGEHGKEEEEKEELKEEKEELKDRV